MCGSGAVSCSCSLLIRGPILPAVRQKLHLSPCADSRNRLCCTFTSITPRTATGWSYNSRGRLETKYYRVFEVKAKCGGEGETWSETMFLSYFDGTLEHQSFSDNELPGDLFEGSDTADSTSTPVKTFWSEKYGKRTT